MKVLAADDDATSLLLLTRVLARWGYEAVPARDGAGALAALLAEDAPSLAIIDWMMPELDGIEVCRRLREQELALPPYVILLTARDGKEDIVTGLNAGANDYVGKPFDADELRARLDVGRRYVEMNQKLLAALEALERQALTDSLTGILNRGAVVCRLKEEMARADREGTPLSAAILDIDHFKVVNDTFGHLAGDEALRVVVRSCQEVLRAYDLFGRYGGEEFLLVLPSTTAESARLICERVRAQVEALNIHWQNHTFRVTVSLGVAALHPGLDVDSLLGLADHALYQAKERGRNRVECSEEAEGEAANPQSG